MSLSREHRRSRLGILIHRPRHYDFQVWLATGGREAVLRRTILRLSRLVPGESVLDIGCGTGTLAVDAARQIGPAGEVHAIDASPEMAAAARRKASKADVRIDVREAPAQALPFPDARFDLVTSTFMLHHLPRPVRDASVREMARVLRPGGRALLVDFASSSQEQGGLFHRLHRHGRVKPAEIDELIAAAGMAVIDSGPVGFRDLHFFLSQTPEAAP